MRLINADALISRLNDYALQNAPIYGRRQNDSAYDTIQNCIKAVGECKSVNCVQEIKRQVENTHQDLGGLEPYKNERWFKIGLDLMYDQVMDIIKHMGGKETGWIPVSERMPERNKSVLLCMKSRSSRTGMCIQTGSYDNGFWFIQGAAGYESLATFEFHVLAWMPFPEPYREV